MDGCGDGGCVFVGEFWVRGFGWRVSGKEVCVNLNVVWRSE